MDSPIISHVEWRTPDPEACAAFLHGLFGWHFQRHGGSYREYCGAGVCVALMAEASPPPAGACQGYLRVADLDDILRRVSGLGGGIALPARDIPGYGRYARITAPEGTEFGIFEQHKAGAAPA